MRVEIQLRDASVAELWFHDKLELGFLRPGSGIYDPQSVLARKGRANESVKTKMVSNVLAGFAGRNGILRVDVFLVSFL